MFNLILTVAMIQAAPAAQPTAQFRPCVWPNTCVQAPVVQFQPCSWPNRCSVPVAQVQTCQWPPTCQSNS